MVAAAEVDLGIGSPVGDTSGLECTHLLSAPLGLLARPASFALGARVSAKALPDLPLLKDAADTSIMQLLRAHGSELVARLHRGVEVSDLSVQLALARAGVGVAVVSALGASHPEAARLRFAPLVPRIERQLFLLRRRDARPSAAVEALEQAVHEENASAPLHPLVRRTRVA
jgi:LysR family carnitine catabolism transcriptional activator